MRVRFYTKNQFFRCPWLASASAAALMATSAHAQEVPAHDKPGAGAPAQSATSATGDKGTPVNGTLPRDGSGTQTAIPADAAGTIAQPDTTPNGPAGDEIVVTGFRQSLATAQALKFNSDQFVDSITATDIGKLPDKNVSEALQRISGIQIDRTFGEGSGVQIRGLSQVKTELNGRDVFGGSGGRSLNFEDVPSELLAGVDVYKNPSSKEIEGGIGGLVNLRTRMPFDEKGFVLSASMGANYYDLAKDARFNGSVLLSKTWQNTGIGDIGFLFDVSTFEGVFRRDQASIEPYVDVNNVPGRVGQVSSVPDGAGIQVTEGSRKRRGYYGAVQWEPASNLQFYGTFFRSQYDLYTPNYSSFVTRGTDTSGLANLTPNGTFAFANDGSFLAGGYAGLVPAYSEPPYVNTALSLANNTQAAFNKSVTTDYAGGVKWQPTDRLHLNLDVQYIRATASNESYTAFAQKDLASYYVDLRGDLPQIVFGGAPGGAANNDLSAYRVTALMDHFEDSVATQKAARFDAEWDFDNSPLTSLQAGIRYTDRDAINRSTPYNWTGASNSALPLNSTLVPGVPNPYDTLFDGKGTNIVGEVPYISANLFDNASGAFQSIVGRGLSTFTDQDVNTQREKTYSGYAIAYFKFDAGLPIDGNIGVRVVKTTTEGVGSTRLTYRDTLLPGSDSITVDQPFAASQNYTKVLPSLNLRGHITERFQVRVGASKGLSRPNFADLRAIRNLSLNYTATTNTDGTAGPFILNGATGSGGNPALKPLTVDQADFALEWNASRSTFLYGTVFYKKLKNFTTSRLFNVAYEVPGQGTQTFQYTALVNGTKGTVKGAEIGGNTFFDFLPGPLSGLGVQANATYVDSDAPGNGGILFNGDPAPTQLERLSKWSYNLVGLYEKYGFSARAAYNWRSKYLDTTAGNGTLNVPIFYRAYGQLDASISYNFNPKVSVTVDAINLTKSRYDSYQYFSTNPRNYELNDRRFGVTFRMRN